MSSGADAARGGAAAGETLREEQAASAAAARASGTSRSMANLPQELRYTLCPGWRWVLDEGNLSPALAAGHFYGAVDARWATGLVTLSVVRHAQRCQVPLHSHEHLFLSLLLRGAYREWVEGREVVFRPMTVVFHPEHLQHRDEISAPD